MSKCILIIGESGSGKTTSCRNLDPNTTFYIDCDKKGLSWKGWRKQYNSENKNYIATSKIGSIENLLNRINGQDLSHVKTVIIDTLNACMLDDEFGRMREKNFDKWMDLASSVYNLVIMSNTLRDDLNVICIGHSQTDRDDNGFQFTRMKTSGKKLDKIVLESKFTTVLLSKCVDGKYVFETQSKNSTAKSPMGCFDTFEIDNDIKFVIEKMEEY